MNTKLRLAQVGFRVDQNREVATYEKPVTGLFNEQCLKYRAGSGWLTGSHLWTPSDRAGQLTMNPNKYCTGSGGSKAYQ